MRIALPAISVALLFAAAWSLALVHPFGNPRSEPAEPRAALLERAALPDPAKEILRAKCADCHSTTTHWPVYSRLAPVSWLLERDVTQGRAHMNLSEWRSLPLDRQQALAQQIARATSHNAMPPMQYRLVHWGSAISPADRATLAALAPVAQTGSAATEPGDAERGKSVFQRRCTGCHAIDANREGPHLGGVYGRRAGALPDFRYSAALKSSGIVWKEDTLEQWLSDTDAAVPDSAMGFRVPKAQDRADLIAFLKTLR